MAAGLVMVIMGINMLGLFPWLRKFTFRMQGFIARKIGKKRVRADNMKSLWFGQKFESKRFFYFAINNIRVCVDKKYRISNVDNRYRKEYNVFLED